MRKRATYRAKGVAVLDALGGSVYDLLKSKEEACKIRDILNDGIGPEWDAVEPELYRRRAEYGRVTREGGK